MHFPLNKGESFVRRKERKNFGKVKKGLMFVFLLLLFVYIVFNMGKMYNRYINQHIH